MIISSRWAAKSFFKAGKTSYADSIVITASTFVNNKASLISMTDEKENDAFFKENAQVFLTAQEMIYKEPEKAKEHYSNAIQACISCHEVKCSGPIPRIKKLQLKP